MCGSVLLTLCTGFCYSSIGVGRQFEVGVLNRLVRVCKEGGGVRGAKRKGLYIYARKKRKLFAKSGGAIAPTAPTVPTPIYEQ